MEYLKRSWVEIDIDNIEHNVRQIKNLLSPGTGLMAVVKADAYGHGAKYTASLFNMCGVDWFGVSNINEAVSLRKSGIKKPILILGYTPPQFAPVLNEYKITQAVVDLAHAQALSRAAHDNGTAIEVHIKVDSGMARLGFDARNTEQAARDIDDACSLPSLYISGIFTHFAVADGETLLTKTYTKQQFERFDALLTRLRRIGLKFKTVHSCNSAGAIFFPAFHQDLARVGIALYGLSPNGAPIPGLDLRCAMSLKSTIAMIKPLKAGEGVSYGLTYTADKDIVVATIPLGYADGYPRQLGNRGVASIKGHIVPVVGTVCMDQLLLDVSEVPSLRVGDTVSFFGHDCPVSIDNVAGLCGTINYEIACGMSRRLPRIYKRGSHIVEMVDYTLEEAGIAYTY